MPPTTPSVANIRDLIITQLESELSQTIPALPIGFCRLIAKTFAGVFIVLWKYANGMWLQWFVSTASWDYIDINGVSVSPLREWGRLIGEGDPTQAIAAEYTIEITVENQVGTMVAGTQLTSALNRVIYITKTDVALSAATVTVDVVAVDDATGTGGRGTVGNLTVGDTLSFIQPQQNVARDTEITVALVTGVNGETEEEYRDRVRTRFRARPQGGATTDYSDWGLDVAGIVNIYPYTGDPGEVNIYAEANTDSDPDGIPTAGQLSAVDAAIQTDIDGLASRRPVTALVNAAVAITRTGFDVDITALSADDLATVKADIYAALIAYFLEREPYIAGLTSTPRTDKVKLNDVISTVAIVVSAANGTFTAATLEESAVPITTYYTLGEGEKAKLGTLSFDSVAYP